MDFKDIIKFWFEELSPEQHFSKDADLDKTIKDRFGVLLNAATRCELSPWRESALGRLGEIILLDQFSRSIYRDRPEAFANDPLALALSQEALRTGADRELNANQKLFLYLPFMHSESKLIHKEAEKIFNQEGLEEAYDFEIQHKKIIDRFGRYPHRNKTLGRKSTPEELEFLQQPGSSF